MTTYAVPATVQITRSVPRSAEAVGVPVGTSGTVPRILGLSRAALAAHGFEGNVGQSLVLPSADGPTLVAVGIGDPAKVSATVLRNAAAAVVRGAGKRAVVATTLADLGVGTGDRVAFMLANSAQHVAALLGACKQRAVPLNVNQHYTVEELRHLLGDAEPAVVICEDAVAPAVRAALGLLGAGADEPAVHPVGALDAELGAATAQAHRSDRRGDDRYLLYTGGTTGLPQGVEWRQEDLYFAALGGGDRAGLAVTEPGDVVRTLAGEPTRVLVACPLMHGTAQWVTLGTLLGGGTVVLSVDEAFHADALLDLAQREAVGQLVLVGDAYAVPLADALDRSHDQRVEELAVELQGSQVVIALRSEADTNLELWAGGRAAEVFKQVYGLPLVIQTRK